MKFTNWLIFCIPYSNNGVSASRVKAIQTCIKFQTVDSRPMLTFSFISYHIRYLQCETLQRISHKIHASHEIPAVWNITKYITWDTCSVRHYKEYHIRYLQYKTLKSSITWDTCSVRHNKVYHMRYCSVRHYKVHHVRYMHHMRYLQCETLQSISQ